MDQVEGGVSPMKKGQQILWGIKGQYWDVLLFCFPVLGMVFIMFVGWVYMAIFCFCFSWRLHIFPHSFLFLSRGWHTIFMSNRFEYTRDQ